MPKKTRALYAMAWRPSHYTRGAKVSRAGGCAIHGTNRCGESAVATVVHPLERNAACARWMAEHPRVEWREQDVPVACSGPR
jgi:hypothetical protein